MNIIEALFHDAISVSSREDGREGAIRHIAEAHQELLLWLEKLPDSSEAKEILHQMTFAQRTLSERIEMDRFVEGFQMGMRFAADAFVHPKYDISE